MTDTQAENGHHFLVLVGRQPGLGLGIMWQSRKDCSREQGNSMIKSTSRGAQNHIKLVEQRCGVETEVWQKMRREQERLGPD